MAVQWPTFQYRHFYDMLVDWLPDEDEVQILPDLHSTYIEEG
jgi:hypothetical protein